MYFFCCEEKSPDTLSFNRDNLQAQSLLMLRPIIYSNNQNTEEYEDDFYAQVMNLNSSMSIEQSKWPVDADPFKLSSYLIGV